MLRVERAELLRPDDLAVHVERGDQTDAAEVHVHALAVGDRRFRRVAVLDVPQERRIAAGAARAPSGPCRS